MLIFAKGFAGCANTSSVSDQSIDSASSSSSNYEELEELYWSRIQSDRMSFSDADVHFMTGMIGHHAQALIMSRLAPKNNASPQIQTLAARIINSQQDEIRSMQNWLRLRNQPVPEVHINGLNLIPAPLAADITARSEVPTIGIGAGVECDGQVLVLYDMLGLNDAFKPKFLRTFADLGGETRRGLAEYVEAVRSRQYPGPEHSHE